MSETLERTQWHETATGRRAVADFIAETIGELIEERDWYRAAWQDVEGLLKAVQNGRDKLVVELCEHKTAYQEVMSKYDQRGIEIEHWKGWLKQKERDIEIERIVNAGIQPVSQEADHGDEKPATEAAAGGG